MRSHEICRVSEVSLSHAPSQHLRAFLVKKNSVTEKVLSLFERCKFTSLRHTRNLFQNKRTAESPQSIM